MNEFHNSLCAGNDLKPFVTSVSGFLRRSGGDRAGSN
jgi:hypothetical protein